MFFSQCFMRQRAILNPGILKAPSALENICAREDLRPHECRNRCSDRQMMMHIIHNRPFDMAKPYAPRDFTQCCAKGGNFAHFLKWDRKFDICRQFIADSGPLWWHFCMLAGAFVNVDTIRAHWPGPSWLFSLLTKPF